MINDICSRIITDKIDKDKIVRELSNVYSVLSDVL